jgi:hypothetical protein
MKRSAFLRDPKSLVAPGGRCAMRPGRLVEDGISIFTVRTITADAEEAAIATLVLAFVADPIARWTWPHSRDYLAGMPHLVRAFAGNSFTHHPPASSPAKVAIQ